ncbi:sensor histidine kinase [Leifsonia shinshuensis]|uniref:Oxygen sensor histidine kinase NreB n=1 Tax=Leifsonia shinshuensis TaxID=150026 RepID=A0A7G6YAG9_9MICO|nr:sensor histidine kinase [Leifsonia shinshuensis]QNE35484.1 sensor histidine kinase [Leifsonia shinshuensis]
MSHSALTPVFVGLRVGLHVLIAGLLVLVLVRLPALPPPAAAAGLALVVVFAAVYVSSAFVRRVPEGWRRLAATVWVTVLALVWVGLVILVPEAAYLAFPLFFLLLHLLPRWLGPVAVVVTTAIAILALGLHQGFSVGAVIGPLIGAGVAILLGLGYRALAQEAAEREALLAELLSTRDRLAETEREQGALAERARLAREIHDTVAQGLSSIQLLLHAAERADPDRPGIEHVRLARDTAADSLAETRAFIRELTPPALDAGLGEALRRLGEAQSTPGGLRVEVETPPSLDLPMDLQTALLRIAQGAIANVRKHARADRATLTVRKDGDSTVLVVADDGVGFDPGAVAAGPGGADSFGLRAIAERVAQLDGTLDVDSAPGRGTRLTVTVPARADGGVA